MDAKALNVELEALRRENARLRGDLRTIAIRMAHDLRRPLGGIIYPGEAVKLELGESHAAIPTINSMLGSVDELSQLIRRLSFVTKATSEPAPLKSTDMGTVVARAMQRVEVKANKAGIVITKSESWPEVHGVDEWLEMIWWNLLANVLQHAGTAPRIEVGWKKQGREHRFWVTDNGPGVAKNLHKKLFQPFETLHEPDSVHGLGLSIAQRLIVLQGGGCGFQTPSGGGATFFFTLPIAS